MPEMSFRLESSAFENGTTIPKKHTCEGENVSPELTWGDPPAPTCGFALIMDDPDALGGPFTHWVLVNIPVATRKLSEGLPDVGTTALNDFGADEYHGPCPPPGDRRHRYFFNLYALDRETLPLSGNVSRAEVERAMDGHVLSHIQIMGTYQRIGSENCIDQPLGES